MKQVLTAAFVSILTLSLSAPMALAQSNVGGMRSDVENEKVVRALYERFTKAWNNHDAKAMGAMWAIDGDHQEPDGRTAKGRAEVIALLTKQHETVFKTTELTLKLRDVWFITADVALVDGFYSVAGILDPQGNEIPTRSGHITSIILRDRGEWVIAASRLMIPSGVPYRSGS